MANLTDVAQRVAQRSKHKLARGTVDLPLPIYEGQYAGRFGVLDADGIIAFEREMEQANADDSDLTERIAQFVADSCRVVLARSEAGGEYEKVTHDDGRPVRFDEDFASALDLTLPDDEKIGSMADVVRAVWCVEDSDGGVQVNSPALNTFGTQLLGWMQDTSQEIAGELVGGLNGTRQ